MTNNPGRTRAPTRRDVIKSRHIFRWARMGWEDARNGRGYSAEYETASQQDQNNYEIGRIQAVNVIAAGLKAPVWPEKTAIPKWISPLWESAALIAGNARCDIR